MSSSDSTEAAKAADQHKENSEDDQTSASRSDGYSYGKRELVNELYWLIRYDRRAPNR